MDLVKEQPETVNTMSPSMPPIKDERRDEVGNASSERRRYKFAEMKE
jgi:hypothetical protein